MDPADRLTEALAFARREAPADATRVPGVVLALYRVASGVAPVQVARVMDVSRQYIAALEDNGAIIETAGRYRAAVDMLAAGK